MAWIYESTAINRLFYEDYLRAFDASPFEMVYIDSDVEHVDRQLQLALERRYPGYARFDIRNARVLLKKPEATP